MIFNNTAGAVLPELTSPAAVNDVKAGKEYINGDGEKQTGTFVTYEDAAFSGVGMPATYTNDRISRLRYYAFTRVNADSVSFPNVTYCEDRVFDQSLVKHISLPSLTNISGGGNNGRYLCVQSSRLESVDLPNLIYGNMNMFDRCTSLTSVYFPKLKRLDSLFFNACSSLLSVKLPAVTEISGSAFQDCTKCVLYDFRDIAAIPTLKGTGAFRGINANCQIVVPDALYDDWIAASNWSAYADYTVRESDYND